MGLGGVAGSDKGVAMESVGMRLSSGLALNFLLIVSDSDVLSLVAFLFRVSDGVVKSARACTPR